MNHQSWRLGFLAPAFSVAFLVACQGGLEAPPRFSVEMYRECAAIERAWEPDYAGLAKRRFATGKNVFLYSSSPLGSGLPIYAGLHDTEWNLTEVARAAISRGGSWGVAFPDTGCPNIPAEIDEDYMELYNRFALTLYMQSN